MSSQPTSSKTWSGVSEADMWIDLGKELKIARYQCTGHLADGSPCDKTSMRANDLVRHYKGKHLCVKEFPCPMCHREFAQRTQLKTHVDTHNKVKPHECCKCGQAFTDSSARVRHEWNVHAHRAQRIVKGRAAANRAAANTTGGPTLPTPPDSHSPTLSAAAAAANAQHAHFAMEQGSAASPFLVDENPQPTAAGPFTFMPTEQWVDMLATITEAANPDVALAQASTEPVMESNLDPLLLLHDLEMANRMAAPAQPTFSYGGSEYAAAVPQVQEHVPLFAQQDFEPSYPDYYFDETLTASPVVNPDYSFDETLAASPVVNEQPHLEADQAPAAATVDVVAAELYPALELMDGEYVPVFEAPLDYEALYNDFINDEP